jgi:hypothetical protein
MKTHKSYQTIGQVEKRKGEALPFTLLWKVDELSNI